MRAKTCLTLDIRTLKGWREWLADHHGSHPGIWLVFHKRHTGKPAITYEDAVDEALCFGWIDSLIKRLDDDRYARKFTPRKADSRWSELNRKRYARLKASGRIMPSGAKRAPTDRTYEIPRRRAWKLPSYIRAELERHATAWNCFQQLPPSHRRRTIGWIDSAKQQETKLRRLQEAVRVLSSGRRLGLK
jgi:uncharacterized protein YdeI (YjbR/CyaY-like superfamily)